MFDAETHLFTSNAQVDAFNLERLQALAMPVATIRAHAQARAPDEEEDVEENDAADVIYMAVNARVMLRKNLWVDKGQSHFFVNQRRKSSERFDKRPH